MSNNDEPKDLHHYFPKAAKPIVTGQSTKRKSLIMNISKKPTLVAEPIQPHKPIRKPPGQKIPKRLSPLHYWKAHKYTSDKKNTDLSIRDVNVIIYWHFENVCIKGKVDLNNFSKRILKGLRTLRKDYEIEKIIGIGDKRGFSDEQWNAFENDPKMEMIHIPHVDRRKAAVKDGDEFINLIHRFLVDAAFFFIFN